MKKSKEVEIKIIKTYLGKRLLSRWKTTTVKWVENGRTYCHTKQDSENFNSLVFSGMKIEDNVN